MSDTNDKLKIMCGSFEEIVRTNLILGMLGKETELISTLIQATESLHANVVLAIASVSISNGDKEETAKFLEISIDMFRNKLNRQMIRMKKDLPKHMADALPINSEINKEVAKEIEEMIKNV